MRGTFATARVWAAAGALALGAAAVARSASCQRPDVVIADFEGASYGAWSVEGTAFGQGPARGTLPGQMPVTGYLGTGLVNSCLGGDGSMGRLLSPRFRIERRFLNFLVGGGAHAGTRVRLIVDGIPVRAAAGPNDRPGGSERLEWHTWEVADLEGRTGRIEILDREAGGWGHINVDQIVQSDIGKAVPEREARRSILLDRPWMHLPVRTGAPKRRMALAVDGRVVREFEIELAESEPGFHVFLDVRPWRGRAAEIRVDRLPEGSRTLQGVRLSDRPVDEPGLYRERLRPQFHFSSRRGWNNDPNGLVFHKGEWHLYYQHNPYGWAWGNMHWGHAVSRDLVHWLELPIALYPREFGDWAFSGSAVVDHRNTAGFRVGPEDAIVAAYTSTGRGECIVYSTDRGRTFREYAGNPVLRHEGRDPRLLWHEGAGHWVMAVYDVRGGRNGILFLSSPNLKDWKRESWIEGYFECPDLFELPVDGNRADTRWLLHAADGAYALGRFDGRTFTPETPKLPASWGNAFYAAQSFSDVPPRDGRRIRIGWGQAESPGMPFNQMMTFPVTLELRTTSQGIRLFTWPVREISRLYAARRRLAAGPLAPAANPMAGIRGELLDVELEVEPGGARSLELNLRGIPVRWEAASGTLFCCGRSAPLVPEGGRIRLRALVDRTSIELFGNGGQVYMPLAVIPRAEDLNLSLSAAGGAARVCSGEVRILRSAWAAGTR